MQNLTEPIEIVSGVPAVANPCADPPVSTWDPPFAEAAPDALVILAGEDRQELQYQVDAIVIQAAQHGGAVIG